MDLNMKPYYLIPFFENTFFQRGPNIAITLESIENIVTSRNQIAQVMGISKEGMRPFFRNI